MTLMRNLLVVTSLAMTGCYFLHGGGGYGGMKDQGITGPTHKAHVGGMVFSNALVIPGKENPSTLSEHCTLGDGCYAAFYLAKAAHEYAGRHPMGAGSFVLRASFDGGAPVNAAPYLIYDYESAGNFDLLRAPGDDAPLESHFTRWFLEQFSGKLTPGDHSVDLSVLMADASGEVKGQPVATGKVTITAPGNASSLVAQAMAHENKIASQQGGGADEAGGEQASATDSSSSSADSGGKITLDNQSACNNYPSYRIEYTDGNGGGATGGWGGGMDVDLEQFPATVCLTTTDPNNCASNTVTVTKPGQTVKVTSCHHIKLVSGD